MKKTIVIFGALAGIFMSTLAQNRSISFETGTWSEILAKAKIQNKIIFIDYHIIGCMPCRWMEQKVFTDSQVATYYNKTFICIRLDGQEGEGMDLAEIYDVMCYPSFLFIDSNGTLIHRAAGARPIENFIQLGKEASIMNLVMKALMLRKLGKNQEFLQKTQEAIELAKKTNFKQFVRMTTKGMLFIKK